MKQILKNTKTGKLLIEDVPTPGISKGMVLLANKYAVVGKEAEEGPQKNGFNPGFDWFKNKKIPFLSLNSSIAGTILSSSTTNSKYQKGDRVACGKPISITHAEYVAVPEKWLVKVPDNVSIEEAAFTSIGALAMQSVKRAKPILGEKVGIIGMNLIGQIVSQLLKVNGCNLFGIDKDDWRLDHGNDLSLDIASNIKDPNLINNCMNFTNGQGFDFIYLINPSKNKIASELIPTIAKPGAKIVIVNPSKSNISLPASFFSKSLNIITVGTDSKEKKQANKDWLITQDMQAFLHLVAQEKVLIKPLITYIFNLWEVEKAYKIIKGDIEDAHLGILLRFQGEEQEALAGSKFQVNNNPLTNLNLGYLIESGELKHQEIHHAKAFGASLDTLMHNDGLQAKQLASKLKFNNCSSDYNSLLENETINCLFINTIKPNISTLLKGLRSGKNLFSKNLPLLNLEELKELMEEKIETQVPFMVGCFKRFSPIIQKIKPAFESLLAPLTINVQISGAIENTKKEPSINNTNFKLWQYIDLIQYLTDAKPILTYATLPGDYKDTKVENGNVNLLIKLSDGSIANISYLNNSFEQVNEQIKISGGDIIVSINNFKTGSLNNAGKITHLKSASQGQKECVYAFLDAIEKGADSPIAFESICNTLFTTYKIMESLKTGLPQEIHWNGI